MNNSILWSPNFSTPWSLFLRIESDHLFPVTQPSSLLQLAQIREYHANDLIPGRLLSHEEPPSDEESEEEEEEGEGTTDEDESIDEDDESAEEGDDDNVAGDVDDLDGDEDDGNGMDEGLDT